jgi:hypothetical protein
MSLSSIANNQPRDLNTSTLSSDCPYAVNDTTIARAESTAACCYIFLSIASQQYWDVLCEVLSTRWVYCNPQRSHFGSGCNPSIVTQSQGWRAWKCHQRVQLVSCSYTARHWAGGCAAHVSVWCIINPRLVFYEKVLVNNPRLEHPMLSLKIVGQRAHRQLFVANVAFQTNLRKILHNHHSSLALPPVQCRENTVWCPLHEREKEAPLLALSSGGRLHIDRKRPTPGNSNFPYSSTLSSVCVSVGSRTNAWQWSSHLETLPFNCASISVAASSERARGVASAARLRSSHCRELHRIIIIALVFVCWVTIVFLHENCSFCTNGRIRQKGNEPRFIIPG